MILYISELQNCAILTKSKKIYNFETEFTASILIKNEKMYCSTWVTLRETEKKIEKNGTSMLKIRKTEFS